MLELKLKKEEVRHLRIFCELWIDSIHDGAASDFIEQDNFAHRLRNSCKDYLALKKIKKTLWAPVYKNELGNHIIGTFGGHFCETEEEARRRDKEKGFVTVVSFEIEVEK